jgi:AraC-like DNA-binding protein
VSARTDTFGLACRRVQAAPMPDPHRHDDVELNLLERGSITYLVAGHPVRVEAGRLTAFWAAPPHQIVEADDAGALHWLTVPLAAFLGAGLPPRLVERVLHGPPAQGLGGDPDLDARVFDRWRQDLETGLEERRAIVRLEVEARLRRLDLELGALEPADGAAPGPAAAEGRASATLERAARMARHVAERYTGECRVEDVARAAGLRPSRAMAVFRETFGLSVGEYVTRHRVAHAQRLLATTDRPVLDVAAESGFGSVSRFHEAFRRAVGASPAVYRRAVREGAPGSRTRHPSQ